MIGSGSIGLPCPGADVRVVSPEGTECADDQPGEVQASGEADQLPRGVPLQQGGCVGEVALVSAASQRAYLAAGDILKIQDRAEAHDHGLTGPVKIGHLQDQSACRRAP